MCHTTNAPPPTWLLEVVMTHEIFFFLSKAPSLFINLSSWYRLSSGSLASTFSDFHDPSPPRVHDGTGGVWIRSGGYSTALRWLRCRPPPSCIQRRWHKPLCPPSFVELGTPSIWRWASCSRFLLVTVCHHFQGRRPTGQGRQQQDAWIFNKLARATPCSVLFIFRFLLVKYFSVS